MQPSCQNAEVVEAFCRAAASRSNTRRSIQQPRPLLHFTRPAEMPPLHSLRFALASRLPSRTAPTLNPHSARCLAGAQLPAISCLGAFRPPALGVRGETVIPAAENLHRSRHVLFRIDLIFRSGPIKRMGSCSPDAKCRRLTAPCVLSSPR